MIVVRKRIPVLQVYIQFVPKGFWIFIENNSSVCTSYQVYFSILIDLDQHDFWQARSIFEQKYSSWTS